MITLTPEQVGGSDWLSAEGGRDGALLHWDQGVGKTYTSISAAERVRAGPALVLCPAVARRNWRRELQAMQVKGAIVVVENSKANVEEADWIVCSYDMARQAAMHRRLMSRYYGVLILDELQYCKNPKAARTKAVFGANKRAPGLARQAGLLWALSGTPAPNNVSEIFPWAAACFADQVPTRYWDFVFEYCKTEKTDFGVKIVGNSARVDDLQVIMGPYVNRLRKQDALANLPPVRFAEVEVEGEAKYVAEVIEAETEIQDKLEELIGSLTGDALPPSDFMSTLRRYTELAKVKPAVDMVSQEIKDGAMKKVVLFATHIDTIKALQTAFEAADIKTGVIYGAVSAAKRQEAIDGFQSGDLQVFIGQTVAAGTAITLHADGECQDVVFVSADWVPANNAQAVARVHRKGQTGSVLCRFLVLSGSSDDAVTKALVRKSRMLDEAFGEKRDHHAQ